MKTGAWTGQERERGVRTRGRTQDGNGDGSGDRNESNGGDDKVDEDGTGDGKLDGNEAGIRDDGEEAKKRTKPHKSFRSDVENGGDSGGKRET